MENLSEVQAKSDEWHCEEKSFLRTLASETDMEAKLQEKMVSFQMTASYSLNTNASTGAPTL